MQLLMAGMTLQPMLGHLQMQLLCHVSGICCIVVAIQTMSDCHLDVVPQSSWPLVTTLAEDVLFNNHLTASTERILFSDQSTVSTEQIQFNNQSIVSTVVSTLGRSF